MSAEAPGAIAHPPWRVAGALAATQVVHWGSLFYAFSVLMPAMAAETGWAREAVVGAFSAGLLAQAVAAVVVGLLLDRLGARAVMTGGSAAAGIGL
jgi:MFS family permease